MKLWVDDERPVPDASWMLAQTAEQSYEMMEQNDFDVVSLDFVLIGWDSGLDVLNWMRKNNRWPAELRLHSSSFMANYDMHEFATQYGPKEMVVIREDLG